MAFYMEQGQNNGGLFSELLRRQEAPQTQPVATTPQSGPPVTTRFGYKGGDLMGKLSGFASSGGQ